RSVLAALLLGSAAPGYLTGGHPVHGGIAGGIAAWLAALPAAIAMLWHHAVDRAAAAIPAAAATLDLLLRLHRLPGRLIERFGPGNVAAAGGILTAGTA